MNIGVGAFLVGIILIVLKWKKYIVIHNGWIVLCFVVWFILLYVSIHKKNKERNTPRPVYIAE